MMARAHSLSTHAVHTAPPLPPPHQFPNDNVDYDGIDDGGEDDHDGDFEVTYFVFQRNNHYTQTI